MSSHPAPDILTPAPPVDDSFQLFIKTLRGHIQGMFVYTPPSWHPVLFPATPSQPAEVSGEGRAEASSVGSFIHRPSPSPRSGFGSTRFPQELAALCVCDVGTSRKRPGDIPCVAAIWCLSPPPPGVPPTHKFTHGWSRASSMLWELKPNAD